MAGPGGDAVSAGRQLIRSTGLTGMVRLASEYAVGTGTIRSVSAPAVSRPDPEDTPDPGGPAGVPAGVGMDRVLPVLPELRQLLPGRGLRRGAIVAVTAGHRSGGMAPAGHRSGGEPGAPAWLTGATSLLLALLAGASRSGAWCAVVGVPTLGPLAAAEVGIVLDRLALVPDPGPEWPAVVAALIDGVDVVATAVPGPLTASVAGRLAARARQRGTVLVSYGRWAGADVTLEAVRGVWRGLGPGRGRLCCRELTIVVQGRGVAARATQARVYLPAPDGSVPPGPTAPLRSRVQGRPALALLTGDEAGPGSGADPFREAV